MAHPRLGIGIDFGTSNSSVALFDGDRIAYVALERGDDAAVMPSALYLDRARKPTVGRLAVESYMQDNAGRTVRLAPEDLGELTMYGEMAVTVRIHALTDHELPGRLFRSLKRWLGAPSVETVQVFGRAFRIVALITPMLLRLRRAAERECRGALGAVHVGRPVHFEGRSADADRLAVARLREACGYAGLEPVTLYPEPVAASRSFLHSTGRGVPDLLLAFDFGGGTLDLSVLRRGGDDFEVLATHGVPLGGDAIDRTLYRHCIFPELGQGVGVRNPLGRTERFSFAGLGDRLLNWQLAYELNRPEVLEPVVRGMREPGEAGAKLSRLYELITNNLSYHVYRAIERAKIELSEADCATIEVPELELGVRLERAGYERLLQPILDRLRASVEIALDRAGVRAADVGCVVRTGGSSLIPAVQDQLEAMFPGRVSGHDAFTSIAAGLALASYADAGDASSIAATESRRAGRSPVR